MGAAFGVLVGVSAAFGLAKTTPESLGWMTFCAFIIGTGIAKRR